MNDGRMAEKKGVCHLKPASAVVFLNPCGPKMHVVYHLSRPILGRMHS